MSHSKDESSGAGNNGENPAHNGDAGTAARRGLSQLRRRLTYGLNVSSGIILAIAIVLVLNAMSFLHLREHYADATAGRPHVLSQQTRGVLGSLENDYQLVALIDPEDRDNHRRLELMGLFDAASERLSVEFIDPASQFEKHRQFERSLFEMFEAAVSPLHQSIEAGMAELEQAVERTPGVIDRLEQIKEDDLFRDEPAREEMTPSREALELREQVRAAIVRLRQLTSGSNSFVETRDDLTEALERPLPRYAELREDLVQHLRRARDEYDSLARQMRRALPRPSRAENAVADNARTLALVAEPIAAALERALSRLERAEPPGSYEQLLGMLAREDVVVLIGADRIRVVPFEPKPDDRDEGRRQSRAERADLQSTDEAHLIGALARLELLENRPMVVFISASGESPFGENPVTSYTNVARRLVSAGFEVQQWIPFVPGPGGEQRMPAPEPRDGQNAVWVLLPDLGGADAEAHMFETRMGDVLDHMRDRLARGDGAMVITRRHEPGVAEQLGDAPSAILRFLEPWGLSPRLQQTIYRERRSQGQAMNESVFIVDRWPVSLPISEAIQAQLARFGMPSPIELTEPDIHGVEHHELARVTGPDLRTDVGLQGQDPARARLDPATERDSYLIAAAAEARNGRVIAVAERFWATDRITTMGRDPGAPAGSESFPANAELFVNSVSWLAGVESLIAPSPMAMAVPRIGPVEDDARRNLRWALGAGLPGLILFAGTMTWWVRRRG